MIVNATRLSQMFPCLFVIVILSLGMSSCHDHIEPVTISGIYNAEIVGIPRFFDMEILEEFNGEIGLTAPFYEGMVWDHVYGDVVGQDRISIPVQQLTPGLLIWGEGRFNGVDVELWYSIEHDHCTHHYTIIGQKY